MFSKSQWLYLFSWFATPTPLLTRLPLALPLPPPSSRPFTPCPPAGELPRTLLPPRRVELILEVNQARWVLLQAFEGLDGGVAERNSRGISTDSVIHIAVVIDVVIVVVIVGVDKELVKGTGWVWTAPFLLLVRGNISFSFRSKLRCRSGLTPFRINRSFSYKGTTVSLDHIKMLLCG